MGISLKAMATYKCPRCRKGDIFIKPFNILNPLDMPKKCEQCSLILEPEPGYYYGAMYISYIVFTTIMLPITILLVFYFEWSVNTAMAFVIAVMAIFFFKILRGARSLWIHIMIRYDARYAS